MHKIVHYWRRLVFISIDKVAPCKNTENVYAHKFSGHFQEYFLLLNTKKVKDVSTMYKVEEISLIPGKIEQNSP